MKLYKIPGSLGATLTASLLTLSLICSSGSVYVFEGNPFQKSGPLNVDTKILNQLTDGVPLYTEVFYPTTPGTYTPILFIPGVRGMVYPSYYSTAMANFAAYGYVVAGIDPYWPIETKAGASKNSKGIIVKSDAEKSFKLLKWLEDYLISKVFPSEQVYNVSVDWSNLGLLSHSAGADILVTMLQMNSTFAKAAAFLEPYSTNLKSPLSTPQPLPSLSYGTELCMEFPTCCIKGLSYLHFYQNLHCPRIQMNIVGYGHCDILDEVPGWQLCHISGVCRTKSGNNRDLYREVFVPGVLSCFFGQYLQGSPSNLVKLITSTDYMPVQVDHLQADLNCDSSLTFKFDDLP